MNEYSLTLQNAMNLGTPIFNNMSSLLRLDNFKKKIIKDGKFGITVSPRDYKDANATKYSSLYCIQFGLYTVSIDAIKVDERTKRIKVYRVKMINIMDKDKGTTVLLEAEPTDIVDKQFLDQWMLQRLLKFTKTRGYKWWDFVRFSDGNTVLLNYNGETVGYRFKMTHKMLIPLTGEFNLDIDIESARKIGYRPHTFNAEELKVVNGEFVTDYEVSGKHAFDISKLVQVCKDLAVFMYD